MARFIRVNRALLSLLGTTDRRTGSDILHSLKFTHADTANPMTESLIYYTEKSGLLKDVYSLILHCADMRQVPVRVSGNRIFDEHYQTLGYVLPFATIPKESNRNKLYAIARSVSGNWSIIWKAFFALVIRKAIK